MHTPRNIRTDTLERVFAVGI